MNMLVFRFQTFHTWLSAGWFLCTPLRQTTSCVRECSVPGWGADPPLQWP